MTDERLKQIADALETIEGLIRRYPTCEITPNMAAYTVGVIALKNLRSLIADSAPGEQNADDLAVDKFALAMKEKMALKAKQGRGGWNDPPQCTIQHLQRLLEDHVAKGDPVDVANLSMMLWHRGGTTKSFAAHSLSCLTPLFAELKEARFTIDRIEQIMKGEGA